MTGTSDLTKTIMEFADGEFNALVAIETAERLAIRAYRAVEAGDRAEALRILYALTNVTTTRTVTAVKIQSVSDAISQRASTAVAQVMAQRPDAANTSSETAVEVRIEDWDDLEDPEDADFATKDAIQRAVGRWHQQRTSDAPFLYLDVRVDPDRGVVSLTEVPRTAPRAGESL